MTHSTTSFWVVATTASCMTPGRRRYVASNLTVEFRPEFYQQNDVWLRRRYQVVVHDAIRSSISGEHFDVYKHEVILPCL